MPRSCPRGSIYRKSYTRKSGKKVKASCIRSVSQSGRKRVAINRDIQALLSKLRKMASTKSDKALKCPKGTIKRSAYYRSPYTRKSASGRRRRVSSTLVKATCVKDLGKKGKGKSLLGKLRKGDLKRFGYENVGSLSLDQRKRALKRAVSYYGHLPVIKKLNSIYVLTRNVNPKLAGKFKKDQMYVSREYNKKMLSKSVKRLR